MTEEQWKPNPSSARNLGHDLMVRCGVDPEKTEWFMATCFYRGLASPGPAPLTNRQIDKLRHKNASEEKRRSAA